MKLISLLSLSGSFFLGSLSFAVVQPLSFSSETPLPIVRWIYSSSATTNKDEPFFQKNPLAALKRAQLQNQPVRCVKEADRALKNAKGLQAWIVTVELECLVKNGEQLKDKSSLTKLVREVQRHEPWLVQGAQGPLLKAAFNQAQLLVLELQIKTDRTAAWETIEQMIETKSRLDSKQRAALYRSAGELSFIQQRMPAARQFILRSLAENEAPETKEILASIDSTLNSNSLKPSESPAANGLNAVTTANADLEASADELRQVQKITTSLKSGELVTAVEDCVKLIHDYPGGVRAKWAADRVQEIYLGLIDHLNSKNESSFATLTDQVLSFMERADSLKLSEWARMAYNHQQYENALRLSVQAIKEMESGSANTKAFETAADSALALEKYDVASKFYNTLISQYGGTSSSRYALFRVGLIEYRLGHFNASQAAFERLLVLPQSENFEPVARYWLWRALQKTKSDAAANAADILISKFPFSYYGLRASIEKNSSNLDLSQLFSTSTTGAKTSTAKLETTLWLTRPERATYERVLALLQAGWLDEAQAEIQDLPAPVTATDRVLRARLFAAALNYSAAISLVNKAWEEDSSLRREPFLSLDFPREFTDEIKTQASTYSLNPYLIMGLIKQESAYQIRAISSSPAYGLMQMIAPTAKEVASELKISHLLVPDDLFNPTQNIRMGSYYFSKMMARYKGNVPMALAAYNAGPGHFDKWLKSRSSLKDLAQSHSPDSDQELWFDELPWNETSFYVKAILRNYLLYRVLDQGRASGQGPQKIVFPVWLAAPGAS
jgi:soluble lytic murein transglycosylase